MFLPIICRPAQQRLLTARARVTRCICSAAEVHFSTVPDFRAAGYAGGDNILYDNYNAEMITKRSAQMYCQTGSPSFPVVEATIAKAHAVRTIFQARTVLEISFLRFVHDVSTVCRL